MGSVRLSQSSMAALYCSPFERVLNGLIQEGTLASPIDARSFVASSGWSGAKLLRTDLLLSNRGGERRIEDFPLPLAPQITPIFHPAGSLLASKSGMCVVAKSDMARSNAPSTYPV